MLRYHTFTAGAGWAYDYGTADESQEMLEYLLGYSPVHNTKPGTAYPATLITTAERDDRWYQRTLSPAAQCNTITLVMRQY